MIFAELFFVFFKIGLFTLGGGYAMLPMITEEAQKRGWMNSRELIGFIAVSESTPGPFTVNAATYIGTEIAGLAGAVCATAGVVLPSFLIVLIAAKFWQNQKSNRIARGLMGGIKPATVALIAAAVLSVGKTLFWDPAQTVSVSLIGSFFIFAVMLFLQYKKIHPIAVIALSAGCGIVFGYADRILLNIM